MRVFALLFSFVFSVISIAQKVNSFTVTINGEDCVVVPDGSNEGAIPKHILGVAPQDIRVNKKGATWGLGQLVHFYFARNQWYSLENNFLFTPFDFRSRYTNQERYNFYRIELNSTSSFYFSKKEKLKSTTLNIKGPSGAIHPLNFNWPSTIRYGARLGAEYQQYSMNEVEKEELFNDNQNITRTTQLMGQKQLVISAGIVRQQVKGFKCDFCQLGPYDSFNIREFYIDGLVAPFQQVSGVVSDSTANGLSELKYYEGRISDFNYKMLRLGGRIGFRRIGVWAKLPQVILSFEGELGWYTGPSVYNFELSLKLGVYLRRTKGLLIDGIGLIR